MSKVNAHGGFFIVDGAPPVRCDAAEHTIEIEEIIDDVTDSSSGGVSTGLPCIYKVNSVTMSVAEDSTAYPEALGLFPGNVVSLFVKRGALNQYDYISNTIVRTYRKVNDNNGKARRVEVNFEFGSYQHNVNPPPGFGD